MTELVELSNQRHKHLNIVEDCVTKYAASQQIIRIRVTEVAKAATNFPLFSFRDRDTGTWVLATLTSFDKGRNLFVSNTEYVGTYQPTSVQCYPFFLMQSTGKDAAYTIGILESSDAFSEGQGEPIFDGSGKALMTLSRAQKLLEADIRNDVQTYQFNQKLEELGLFKSIDILVKYQDETIHTLAGLHTIDEDKLNALSSSELGELSKMGYLIPLHAMLISLYQLNLLVRKHNDIGEGKAIHQVKIEVAKDSHTAF